MIRIFISKVARRHRRVFQAVTVAGMLLGASTMDAQTWQGYAKNAQHTAQSGVPSQTLGRIVWQTPVDLQPQYQGNDLFIHYGSPVITSSNTVIVPVKTGASDGFQIEAHNGADGSLLWTQTTDYTLPQANWTPSYSPTLTPQGRIYWAAASGSLNWRSNLDAAGAVIPNQVNFYKSKKRKITNSVQVCTPLTSDAGVRRKKCRTAASRASIKTETAASPVSRLERRRTR
jgi:hypothetical protein